jgi:hypothetical protein
MRPTLFLDIEGTLLLCGRGRVFFRPYLAELLQFLDARLDRLDCLWLTSFGPNQVRAIFATAELPVRGIRYQAWAGCKASALGKSGPALWIDDRITARDEQLMADYAQRRHPVRHRLVRRWDGDAKDRELLALRGEIESWLEASLAACECCGPAVSGLGRTG